MLLVGLGLALEAAGFGLLYHHRVETMVQYRWWWWVEVGHAFDRDQEREFGFVVIVEYGEFVEHLEDWQ